MESGVCGIRDVGLAWLALQPEPYGQPTPWLQSGRILVGTGNLGAGALARARTVVRFVTADDGGADASAAGARVLAVSLGVSGQECLTAEVVVKAVEQLIRQLCGEDVEFPLLLSPARGPLERLPLLVATALLRLLGADPHEASECLGEIDAAAAEEPLLQEVLSAELGDAESVAALLQGAQEPSAEATRLKKDLRSMQKQLGAAEVPPEDARLREMALAGARLAAISHAADAAAALFFRGWALVRAGQQASAREALRLGRCLARMGKAKEELLRQLDKELAALPASAGLSGRLIVEPEEAGDAVDCAREVAVAQAAPGQAWRLLPCPARFSWIIYGPPSALLAASCSPEEEHRAALEALGLKNSVAADGEAVHVTVEAIAASLKAGEGCHVHGEAGPAVACFLCKYGFGFPEDFNPLLPAHGAEEAIDLVKGLQGELGEEGEAAVVFFEKALWGEIMMGSVQKQSKKAAAKKEADAVQPLGGKVVRQPGDGNCLFHSMAYVLGGEKAAPLRKKVCEFMLDHPEFEISGTSITDWLQMSAQCSVAEYCKRMQRAGEWGGAPEIAVCARMKGVNIHVYQPAGAAFELVAPFNGGEDGEPCGKTVSVVYVGQMHYDALLL